MMPTNNALLKAIALAALLACGPAQAQDDAWYAGFGTGFWGLGNSVGFRGTLPGEFPAGMAEANPVQRQFGGYRITDSLSIEGAQTSYGPNGSGCNGDAPSSNGACVGAAWSLEGIATLPIRSGLSVHGRLGLRYWQNGTQEELAGNRNAEDVGRMLGLGISYELSRAVTFHAESEHFSDLTGSNAANFGASLGLDASVHSIGLSIKF